MGMFRKLTADEIDCRVSTINEKGLSLLLYKDARVDQNILDEAFGVFGWQRKHEIIGGNLYCTVTVKNPETGEWISKQDVGTESNTEKEKGQASDSFKRACFNLGIGRELYTAPFIWINVGNYAASERNGKPTTYDRFSVKSIGYDDAGKINSLEIINNKTHKVVYSMGKPTAQETPVAEQLIGEDRAKALAKELKNRGIKEKTVKDLYKVKNLAELKEKQLSNIAKHFDDILASQEGAA